MKPLNKYRLYKDNEYLATGSIKHLSEVAGITHHAMNKIIKGTYTKNTLTFDVELVNVEYAVYKGDDFEMIGDLQQVSKYLGVTPRIAILYSTDSYRNRKAQKTVRVVKMEDDEEMWEKR